MAVITLTKENFEAEALKANVPVLVDFWASWCGPCRMVSPIVDEIAEESDGSYKVGKVNVDEQPELASQFGVMSIPTLIVLENGKVKNTAVGARPKEFILGLLGALRRSPTKPEKPPSGCCRRAPFRFSFREFVIYGKRIV